MKNKLYKLLVSSFVLSAMFCILCIPASAGKEPAVAGVAQTIAIGETGGAIVKQDGTVWTWGYVYGQRERVLVPTQVQGIDHVVSVAAGTDTTMFLALKSDGTVWGWGSNAYNQLNLGEDESWAVTPVQIQGLSDIVAISTEGYWSFAIKSDGSLWGWGANEWCQLGDRTEIDRVIPVKIMDNIHSVSTYTYGGLATTNDGEFVGWGMDYGNVEGGNGGYGIGLQAGLDDGAIMVPCKHSPDNTETVSDSGPTTYYLHRDGTLWAHRAGAHGAIGLGDTENQSLPVQMMTNVRSAVGHYAGGYAITNGDTLWAWGYNGYGQLGDGTVEDRYSPIEIMDNVAAVVSKGSSSLAIKYDGTVWAWGYNSDGQLGNNKGYNYLVEATESTWDWYLQTVPVKIFSGAKVPAKLGEPSPIKIPVVLPEEPAVAIPNAAPVYVDGKIVEFDAFTINDNNYFKLRDLAYILSGTEKQFSVTWDAARNTISLTGNVPYVPVGGEMGPRSTEKQIANPNYSLILLNGSEVPMISYNINGNNYFKLRDLGLFFNFGVNWNAEIGAVEIDTTERYIDS